MLDAPFLEKHRIHKVVHGDDCSQSDFFAVPLELGIMHYLPHAGHLHYRHHEPRAPARRHLTALHRQRGGAGAPQACRHMSRSR